jgi:hypothetical protein
LKAIVLRQKVLIALSDNFVLVYDKNSPKLKVNDKVVFWQSPLTDLPVPVPISKK